MSDPDVTVLDLAARSGRKRYAEILRRESMSVGVYRLAAGGTDLQSPHDEDELYYVLAGKATLETPGRRDPVTAGAAIFVAKGVMHRFVDITSDLELLVVFAPAESG